MTLTARQTEALEAVRQLVHRLGRAPTLAEVAAAIGVGRSRAHRLLLILRRARRYRPAAQLCLTPRQAAALEALRHYREAWGHSPTMEELGIALGVTKGAATRLAQALVRQGAARRAPRNHRCLVPEDEP